VINPNRFSPVGAKLLNLYPEPNTTTSGSVPWQNNYIAAIIFVTGTSIA
jgi:hypothetical protein